MKHAARLVLLTCATLLLFVHAADLRAPQALKLTMTGPTFYCLFDASCNVTATETASTFTQPGMNGQGVLYTRTYAASPGSPAAGHYGYEYRIAFQNVTGYAAANCIMGVRIKLGSPLSTLDFNGDGSADQVFQIFVGGGYLFSHATQDGSFITFDFDPPAAPMCPGVPGNTSVWFGVIASQPPRSVLATIETFGGDFLQVGARAPNLGIFKLAPLYVAIARFPPSAFVAPSLNAAEGRRRAMLNIATTALRHLEEDNVLPALELLQRLVLVTDGDADDWIQDAPQTEVNEQMELYNILQDLIETLDQSRRELCREGCAEDGHRMVSMTIAPSPLPRIRRIQLRSAK